MRAWSAGHLMRCLSQGKLVHQIIEWLYRENRFCSNELKIGENLIGPSTLSVPTLAVVNTADDVAPLNSLKPFADAMVENAQIIEYPGELGVCLQHLGILVGRHAQAHVWPEILSWLKSQRIRTLPLQQRTSAQSSF